MAAGAADRQLAYWKKRLAGPLPILDLRTDRPRPPVQSLRGAREVVVYPGRAAAMECVCRAKGATLFMGMLVAMHTMPRAPAVERIRIALPTVYNGSAKYDLMLQLFPDDDGQMSGFVEYSTDIFDRGAIRRLIGHFDALLQSVIADPRRPIERLAMGAEDDRPG